MDLQVWIVKQVVVVVTMHHSLLVGEEEGVGHFPTLVVEGVWHLPSLEEVGVGHLPLSDEFPSLAEVVQMPS